MKHIVIASLMIISTGLFGNDAVGQEYSANSLKLGFGPGVSMGTNSDGFGLVYTVGYQREIWKERLRFNPNFSIGHYSSKFMLDAPDKYFTSINLEANVYLDIIKVRSLSLLMGGGGLINHSNGLKGTGGDQDDGPVPVIQRSEYFSDFHLGGYLGVGFRINAPGKRTAINIIPINVHFGTKDFAEFHGKIEIDIKLR